MSLHGVRTSTARRMPALLMGACALAALALSPTMAFADEPPGEALKPPAASTMPPQATPYPGALQAPVAPQPGPVVHPYAPVSPPSYAEVEELKARREGARAMEITGIVLTALGTCGLVGGAIQMATVNTHGDFGGFNILPGLIVAGSSMLLLLGPGIPLWIVGAHRGSKLPKPPPPTVSVRTSGLGLVLDGTF